MKGLRFSMVACLMIAVSAGVVFGATSGGKQGKYSTAGHDRGRKKSGSFSRSGADETVGRKWEREISEMRKK